MQIEIFFFENCNIYNTILEQTPIWRIFGSKHITFLQDDWFGTNIEEL